MRRSQSGYLPEGCWSCPSWPRLARGCRVLTRVSASAEARPMPFLPSIPDRARFLLDAGVRQRLDHRLRNQREYAETDCGEQRYQGNVKREDGKGERASLLNEALEFCRSRLETRHLSGDSKRVQTRR